MVKPVDEAVREKIRNQLDRSFLVEASAGTGKTTCLVDRITNALLNGSEPGEIAAITFTNKAADELRSKVLLNLFKVRAAEEKENKKKEISGIIGMMGSCEISTIHSFYGRMLAEMPVEAGLDAEVKVLEDDDAVPEHIWISYAEEKITEFERFPELLFALETLSVSMDSFKKFCFDCANFPDLELSGLPDVLGQEEMIAACIEKFDGFTGWIPGSIGKCNVPDEDIYCCQLRAINETWKQVKNGPERDKIAYIARNKSVHTVAKECMRNWDKNGNKNIGKAESEEACLHLKEINTLISDYLYVLAVSLYDHFSGFFADYKKKHSVLTFVDSLVKTRDMLREYPGVRKYFREKYRMILVDEFQDTDPVQAEVIAILASDDAEPGDWRSLNIIPGKLFVVGDPKQSIYRFRRADISIYEEFKKLFNDEKKEVLKLKQNFRSLKGITDYVNGLFEERIKETENYSSPGYEPIDSYRGDGGGTVLLNMNLAVQEDPADYFKYGKIERGLKNDYLKPREQKTFAGWLRRTIDNGELKVGGDKKAGFGDVLILFKNTKNIGDWERALEEFDIPVENISGKDFYSRDEIREAVAILTAAGCPSDTASVYGALKSPAFGLSDTEVFAIVREAGSLDLNRINDTSAFTPRAAAAVKKLKALCGDRFKVPACSYARYILEETGLLHLYSGVLDRPACAAALVKLASVMESLVNDEGLDFYGALEKLSDLTDKEERPLYLEEDKPAGVRLMTIHQAKGLESPIVALGDMTAIRTKSDRIDRYINRGENSYYRVFKARRADSHEDSKDFESFPEGWEGFKEIEKEFAKQEELRLEYVVSTRAADYFILPAAGSLSGFSDEMIKTARETEGAITIDVNYIDYLASEQKEPAFPVPDNTGLEECIKEKEKKIKDFNLPRYTRENPSELDDKDIGSEDGYGKEHGNTVHGLLDYIMKNPDADIDYGRYDESGTVKRHVCNALNSDIWKRARASGERYSELPVSLYDANKKILTRGSIDLVFKEPDGWVIVDYKTNKTGDPETMRKHSVSYAPQMEAYRKIFEELTGERVKEVNLMFLDNESQQENNP